MGLLSSNGDRNHNNGNVRDTADPNGARHAADISISANLGAVRAIRNGTDGYVGKHRSN